MSRIVNSAREHQESSTTTSTLLYLQSVFKDYRTSPARVTSSHPHLSASALVENNPVLSKIAKSWTIRSIFVR